MKKLPTMPIGAIELVLECQELLAGKRRELTSVPEYTLQRRHYWQTQANRAPRRFRSSLPRRAA